MIMESTILGTMPGDITQCEQAEVELSVIIQQMVDLHKHLSDAMCKTPDWKGETHEAYEKQVTKQRDALTAQISDLRGAFDAIGQYNACLRTAHNKLHELEDMAWQLKDAFLSRLSRGALCAVFETSIDYYRLLLRRMEILFVLRQQGMEHGAVVFEALHREPNQDPQARTSKLTDEDFDQIEEDLQNLSPTMVDQGAFGDCYYLAALAAILNSPQGVNFIRKHIKVHRNSKGERDGFLVTLYEENAEGKLVPRQVFVDEIYCSGAKQHAVTGKKMSAFASVASIYEAAYAQIHPGGTLDREESGITSGYPGEALEHLTGRKAWHSLPVSKWYNFNSVNGHTRSAIIDALKDGKAVTATRGAQSAYELQVPHGQQGLPADYPRGKVISLPSGHAYTIVDANEHGIWIRNPWGMHPGELGNTRSLDGDPTDEGKAFIPWSECSKVFSEVDISGTLN